MIVFVLELVTVTGCEALVVPNVWLANTSDVGAIDMVVPSPVRLTSCGLEGSLSLMVIVPGRFPAPVGMNVAAIVQLLWAGTEVPQVLV